MPPDEIPVFEPPNELQREEQTLAPYAMRTRDSRGRKHPEASHPYRTLYQRDRDRVVHSTAFRRLMYKTQVLVTQGGDHHRTRLTHTLEVAQISRTIARQLGLNEDLTEAIALLHDLGHPPFGHAGEAALRECMQEHGGYEHNHHGLRIVEELEYRYTEFPGLNLSWEVLQAQAHHSKRTDVPAIQEYRAAGQPLLEAQVVDAADSLAYNTHDIDDALSANLITREDLAASGMWTQAAGTVLHRQPPPGPLQFQPAVVRALIDWQVTDLLEQTRRNLRQENIRSVADVRACPRLVVGFSPPVQQLKEELESFLRRRVYQHHRVMRMAFKGQRILHMLFEELNRHPAQLPARYLERTKKEPTARVVCDYLAGMTDRYAQDEFLQLFQPYTFV